MAKKKTKKTKAKKTKTTKSQSKKSGTKKASKAAKKRKPRKRPVSARQRVEQKLEELAGGFIDIDDLFCAYRKAKADLFFDRSQATAVAFCRYEDDLANNLLRLLERLKDEKNPCLLYTSPSPRDGLLSRMPSSA